MGSSKKQSNEASILFSSEWINPIQERSQKEGVNLTNLDLLTVESNELLFAKCKRSMVSSPHSTLL